MQSSMNAQILVILNISITKCLTIIMMVQLLMYKLCLQLHKYCSFHQAKQLQFSKIILNEIVLIRGTNQT